MNGLKSHLFSALVIIISIQAICIQAFTATPELFIDDLKADMSYGTLKNTVPQGSPVPVIVRDGSGDLIEGAWIMDGVDGIGATDKNGMLILSMDSGSFLNIYAKKAGYKGSEVKTIIIMPSDTEGYSLSSDYIQSLNDNYGDSVFLGDRVNVTGDGLPIINFFMTGNVDIKSAINNLFSAERAILYPVIDLDEGFFALVTLAILLVLAILLGGTISLMIASAIRLLKLVNLYKRYSREPLKREEIKKEAIKTILPGLFSRFFT
jgi:hypothetical protein